MENIIIDTSSILFGLSINFDVLKSAEMHLGLKPCVSKGVLRELSNIASSRKANRKYASVATSLIKKYNIKIYPDTGHVDKWILKSAQDVKNICTNDTTLRKKLRQAGIKPYTISMDGEFR
ncbi:MAG: PIN domain-containing protein [Candidatus Micrarchaeaceae archaeon]